MHPNIGKASLQYMWIIHHASIESLLPLDNVFTKPTQSYTDGDQLVWIRPHWLAVMHVVAMGEGYKPE